MSYKDTNRFDKLFSNAWVFQPVEQTPQSDKTKEDLSTTKSTDPFYQGYRL